MKFRDFSTLISPLALHARSWLLQVESRYIDVLHVAVRENEKSNRKSVSEKFQSYPRSGQKPNASAPEQAETRFLRKTYREISKISIYRCSGAPLAPVWVFGGGPLHFSHGMGGNRWVIEKLLPRSFKVIINVPEYRI